MEEKTLELRVGIFIFIGIVLLFIIIFSIGKIYVFQPGYKIKIFFNFAGGIGHAAPVRLAGVGIGEVDGINIFYDKEAQRTKVEIVAWIKKDVKIEKNSVVQVNTLGLLGEKYLEIIPGTEDTGFLADGGALTGEDPVRMDEFAKDLKGLANSAGAIMGKLERGEGTLGKFLTDDTVYKNIEEFTDDIKRHPWKLLKK